MPIAPSSVFPQKDAVAAASGLQHTDQSSGMFDREDDEMKRGLFIRTISVQLVDLSLSGCLLRSKEELPAGAHGELHVAMGDGEYCDAVYVTRCLERQGSGYAHDLGGEFL